MAAFPTNVLCNYFVKIDFRVTHYLCGIALKLLQVALAAYGHTLEMHIKVYL